MNTPNIHVYIALIKDSYIRLSFQGTHGKADGRTFCEAIEDIVSIDYLGALYTVPKTDKGDTIGTRKYLSSTIVACKHTGCLRKREEDKVYEETSMDKQCKGFRGTLHRQREAMYEQG